MDHTQVIDIFVHRGLIDQYLASEIIQEVENSGKPIPELLADYEIINSKNDIWPIIANELGVELIDLAQFDAPKELLALMPAGMARLHGAYPVNFTNEGLTICLVDPLNPQTIEDLRFALGKEIQLVVAPDHIVEKKISDAYGGDGQGLDDILGQLDGGIRFCF